MKKAVLVGISYATNENLKQNGFDEQPGAHRDVRRLRKLLTGQYGYKNENITVLEDDDALPRDTWPTYENIIRAMEDLVAGTKPGDHIFFSFSGHGGQVVAREDEDEEDGQDEILLPIDCTYDPSTPDNFSRFIRDDEIRRILVKKLPEGVRCVMIFDCCHSGTASDLPSVQECLSPTTPTSPLISPGPQSGAFAQMQTVTLKDATAPPPYLWPSTRATNVYPPSRRTSVLVEKERNVTSWSACLDDQVTFGQTSGGIFIKAFTKALEAKPNPTHRQLLQALRKELDAVTKKQNAKMQTRSQEGHPPYVAPRPQLGSLSPHLILHDQFTL
ncbi:peptidase C14 [Polyporus arcularius HHB13444]|uniref:Peptidase C14 n=1 Tax=Polyporus arcularius HHB13444 TaxID=1314778 RepID=A0A5C3PHG5_9APHY|nr:peptidase C14 [Polyporus arcularius HHB13444]